MYIRLKFNLRANRIPERGNPANPAQNQLANIVNPTAMLLALLESTTFIRQIAMSSCLIGLVLLYFTPPRIYRLHRSHLSTPLSNKSLKDASGNVI